MFKIYCSYIIVILWECKNTREIFWHFNRDKWVIFRLRVWANQPLQWCTHCSAHCSLKQCNMEPVADNVYTFTTFLTTCALAVRGIVWSTDVCFDTAAVASSRNVQEVKQFLSYLNTLFFFWGVAMTMKLVFWLGYRLDNWDFIFIYGRSKRFVSSLHPYSPWCSLSLLSSGYWVLFPRSKTAYVWSWPLTTSVPQLIISGTIPPFPVYHSSLHRDNFIFSFLLLFM